MVLENIDAIIQECETYMSTDEGKYNILNPAGLESIANINWNKTNFEARIKCRVDQYVKHFLQSESVVKRYKNIVKEIQIFYSQAISSIKKIENELVDINPINEKDTVSRINFREIGLYSSPAWLTAVGFGLGIPVAIVCTFAFAFFTIITRASKTTKDIDAEYEKCKRTVPTVVRTDLQKRFAVPIKELIYAVTKYLLGEIKNAEKRNEEVWEEREKIVAQRDSLRKLDKKIRDLKETVTSSRQNLKLSKGKE